MSRRFGRKQRRAARELIADLAVSNKLAGHVINDLGEALRRQAGLYADLIEIIQRWDREIRSMLGPYTSFAINDTTFRVDHPDQIRQMQVMPRLPMFPTISGANEVALDALSYHVESVLHLVGQLSDADLMDLSRYFGFQIEIGHPGNGPKARYGMSEKYWNHLKREPGPARDRMIYRMAEEMLRILAQPQKKEQPYAHVSPA